VIILAARGGLDAAEGNLTGFLEREIIRGKAHCPADLFRRLRIANISAGDGAMLGPDTDSQDETDTRRRELARRVVKVTVPTRAA